MTSGNFLEMFDFFLFGIYASYIAKAFFPNESQFVSLMSTFLSFAAGFAMRPIGAFVLGAYIDRIGRRKGLIVTLGIMAWGTILIAFTPGYATIGLAAPILVVIGRLLQGFSAGVELGGVSVYLSEMATPGHKGFYVAWQSASQQVAIIVAALIGFAINKLMAPADIAGLGMAHSVLHRLHDRAAAVLAAPLPAGDGRIPGPQVTIPASARSSARWPPTGARRRRRAAGGDDDGVVLPDHSLHAHLRQERVEALAEPTACW